MQGWLTRGAGLAEKPKDRQRQHSDTVNGQSRVGRGGHPLGRSARSRHRARRVAVSLAILALAALGSAGVFQYVETFWLYRGYAPPLQLSTVVVGSGPSTRNVEVTEGTVRTIEIASPAIGGRKLPVIVYLPPGYAAHPDQHYPVFYLLHGFPGSPQQFINVGDVAALSDILIAEGKIKPMICVMPSGSTSFILDQEWVNSVRPNNAWETYLARDVVNTIDSKYRTIRTANARAIGGLSEGGYGALNIGLHHVGEFGLIEAWSAYFGANTSPTLIPKRTPAAAYNSPMIELPMVAYALRKTHTYFWMYDGRAEVERRAVQFASLLAELGIAHTFTRFPGHHNWSVWRRGMPDSLTVASEFFQHGAPSK